MWTLRIRCDDRDVEIISQSVVLATGPGGSIPSLPRTANQSDYRGKTLHSAKFKSAEPWKGQVGVVVGTANTGHDVAKDMLEAGCSSITMIQRSRTYVLPAEYYKNVLDLSFNDNIPTAVADMSRSWIPIAVARLMIMQLCNAQARQEPERFDALEKAGFLTQRHGDIIHHTYERNGGHYMDVGTSSMIAQGKVCHVHEL